MFHPDHLGEPCVDEVAAMFAAVEGRVMWAAIQAINGFDVSRTMVSCDVPVLVVCAEADVMLPYARWTAEHVPGARLRVVERAGHMAPVESPGVVLGEIEAFVGEVGSG